MLQHLFGATFLFLICGEKIGYIVITNFKGDVDNRIGNRFLRVDRNIQTSNYLFWKF